MSIEGSILKSFCSFFWLLWLAAWPLQHATLRPRTFSAVYHSSFLPNSSASSSSLTGCFSSPLLSSRYQLANLHHFARHPSRSLPVCLPTSRPPSAVHFLNSSRQITTAKTRHRGFVLRTIASSVGGVIRFESARARPLGTRLQRADPSATSNHLEIPKK